MPWMDVIPVPGVDIQSGLEHVLELAGRKNEAHGLWEMLQTEHFRDYHPLGLPPTRTPEAVAHANLVTAAERRYTEINREYLEALAELAKNWQYYERQ